MMYTLEVYARDRRCKSGERLHLKQDYDTDNRSMLEHTVRHTWPSPHYRWVLHETWILRRNAMTGEDFYERYDTPWCCSPAGETYWSA